MQTDVIFIKISYKTEATLIPNIDLRRILHALCAFSSHLAFVHLYYVLFVRIMETSGHKKCRNAIKVLPSNISFNKSTNICIVCLHTA